MSIFEHHRFEIWNQAQHPYKHSLTDLAYTNNALNGVTTAQGALDYILAVLYPNNKTAVANVAALPGGGNTINDYRVVLDDGDGKAAGYRWEQREGEVSASWHKIYDVDFGAGTYLAQAYENYQDLFVHKFGNDDLDAAGAAVTGTFAGQTIFGGKSASTNLTLKANSGDGTGAATGYVQFGDNNRPTVDNTFALGTSALRYTSLFALALNAGASGLTISSNSLTQLTFSSSAARPLLTTTGRMSLEYTIDAGVVGGAIANVLAIVQAGNATSPLNQSRQWGFYSAVTSTSAATHATLSTIGYYSASTTAASAFTAPNRYQFFGEGSTAKGAGSTITRDVVYGGTPAAQGTNNAFLSDNTAFSGSFTFNTSSNNPSVHGGTFSVGTTTSTNAAFFTNAAGILSSVSQQGYNSSITGQSGATTEIIGFKSQTGTANSSFTCSNLWHFYASNTTKGAASTITRYAMYGGAVPTQGTNNCFITDTLNFPTGTWGMYLATGSNLFGGPLLYGTTTVASTATITALSSATSVVKFSGSTATAIQGIAVPTTGVIDGQLIQLFSVGANLTLANENAGASTGNRITTNTGADVAMTAPCAATLIYDSTTNRWIVLSTAS